MRRRDFVTFLSGATAWATAARAQESRRVIGVLGSASYGAIPGIETAFIQGLKNTGFIEGQSISIEWRWADSQYNRLSLLADELVGRNVAVIVTLDVPSSFAAKAATKAIPIVFAAGADPVKLGLVDSFSQPRGNLTGVSTLVSALGPKQLELLHELLPGSSTVAVLVNPSNPNLKIDAPETQAAADALGRHLEVLTASTESDLEAAFTTMVRQRVDALVVKPDPFFIYRRERIVALAARHAMPTIYSLRVFAEVGGLMSYGTNYVDLYRQAGIYTGKILKGAKPVDLPVQQGLKFELVINAKAAKALGLTVSPSLLVRADEVIE
jgi:putative tryptophan/tyrosine transport system substrate-binding protein